MYHFRRPNEIIAAVMALGFFYGWGSKGDAAATAYTYEINQMLSDRFKVKFGSIRCREPID
jgi:hypothetical protein